MTSAERLAEIRERLREQAEQYRRIPIYVGRFPVGDVIDVCKQLDEALDVIRKLSNEAQGFVSQADPVTHGQTNMNVIRQRIEDARDFLARFAREER